MNFRELNERMEQFLEISAETRQRVVDARKQQAQRAMDKYAKAQSLADRHAKADIKPSSKGFETYDQSIRLSQGDEPIMISKGAFDAKYFDTMDRKAIYMSGDRDRAPQGVYYEEIPGLDIHISDPLHVKFEDIDALLKDGEYFIANYDGNCFIGKHIILVIEQVAEFDHYEIDDEQSLREVLKELTDSDADPQLYLGVSEFRKIENEKSNLSTEFEVDEENKKALLNGTFVVPKGHTLAEYVVPAIKEEMITDVELDAILKNNRKMDRGQNSLFPSCWNADELGVFPAQLMEAITRSDDAENTADIYNIYYHRRTFLQPEALGVLSDAILSNVDAEAKQLLNAYDGFEEDLQDIIEITARYAPEAMEALKAKLEGIITA